MKRLIITLFLVLVSTPFWCNAEPQTDTPNFLTAVSAEQKDSYIEVLKTQCELLREKWYADDYAEGENHLLYSLELNKREFVKLTPLYGHCRGLDDGGVPESLINRDTAPARHSGWIELQLTWLVAEDTLSDFSSFVFTNSYERRMRTPWNTYFKKRFKKISSPPSCNEVILNFISQNQANGFPIDVRANTKIYSIDNLVATGEILLEDSSEYKNNYYLWTLLNKDERLLVRRGFEPQASFNWNKGNVIYKEHPAVLKHFLGPKIVVNFKEQKFQFIDTSMENFNIDDYVIYKDSPPTVADVSACLN